MPHPHQAGNQTGTPRPYGRWDSAQDAQLLLFWTTETLQLLARRLGHSPDAVRRRAYRLLLDSPRNRREYSQVDVANAFGVSDLRVKRWMERGLLVGEQCGRGWWFTHEVVRAFALNNRREACSGRPSRDRTNWLFGLAAEEDASQYLGDGTTRASKRGKAGAA